jgi:ATP phosphoribosyltransferase
VNSVVARLALPAGDLREPVASVLHSAGLEVKGYAEGSRSYILSVAGSTSLAARVFREKDIPIQIAMGNYDVGVCGLAWVEELRARFPQHPVVPLADLGVGRSGLYVAAADGVPHLGSLGGRPGLRIASEYPNIAEAFALAARLPAYRVQAVWGAAEAYPPEDADLAVIAAADEAAVSAHGLSPLFPLLETSAWLIANAESLTGKDLSPLLGPLTEGTSRVEAPPLLLPPPLPPAANGAGASLPERRGDMVRPHDMPQLVATGEMDLAVAGRDCLTEHLSRFPPSPVRELVDLGRGQFNLTAAVSEDVPASDLAGALEHWRGQGRQVIRVASEFPGIADAYARRRRLGRYRVIPIAGASEGFVPEDAELLIEGTETGRTLAKNRLKPIDSLFRSTTCLIGGRGRELSGRRRRVFDQVVSALRSAAEAAGEV